VPQTNVIDIRPVLLFTLYNTKNIAYITEELIFYADKIMVMGISNNLHGFYLAILPKSRKFDAPSQVQVSVYSL